jgi:hypothetical protein
MRAKNFHPTPEVRQLQQVFQLRMIKKENYFGTFQKKVHAKEFYF